MMNKDKLVDAIGMIDDEYIKEAHSYKKIKSFNWMWPKRIALAIVCVVLFVSVSSRVLNLSGLGGKSDYKSESSQYNGGDGMYYASDEYNEETSEYDNSEISIDKKMILTANLDLETLDLDKTIRELNNNINLVGAYNQSTSTYSNGSRRYYQATIRIPADKYNEFIETIKGSGNAISYNEKLDDVTDSYYDLEARIKALKAEEERLLDFYKEAETLEELLLVEERLSAIRYEIEYKENQIKNYDLLTKYSTLNITIYETKQYSPIQKGFGSRFVESIKNGLTNFIGTIQDLLIDIAYNIWGILLLVLLVFCGYKSYKFLKNRKYKKR